MSSTETYLVIGGSGFLGRHIVEAFLARGSTVAVLDIVQRYHDTPFYLADISDVDALTEAFKKSGATCILHTASPPHGLDPAIYWKVNVEGTRAVISATRQCGIRKLVFTSSAGAVFNGHDLCDVDERLPFADKPLDAYNESKAKAEELVLEANDTSLLTVALRPSGIFGPGDRQVMVGLLQVYETKRTTWQIGDNTNLFDWTYVTNVAKAHLLAADKLGEVEARLEKRTEEEREELLHRPLPSIDLTTGVRRIPTSQARPKGPTFPSLSPLSPSFTSLADEQLKNDQLEAAFNQGGITDSRPVVRSRFDQLSTPSLELDDSCLQVPGQAFFITNGEPVYFWDFPRAVWSLLGDAPNQSITVLPRSVGLILATLSEYWGRVVGKEPTFTRFRVTFSCTQRWHNIEKARRVLGYEPDVGLMEGVKRMVDWFKKEHLAK